MGNWNNHSFVLELELYGSLSCTGRKSNQSNKPDGTTRYLLANDLNITGNSRKRSITRSICPGLDPEYIETPLYDWDCKLITSVATDTDTDATVPSVRSGGGARLNLVCFFHPVNQDGYITEDNEINFLFVCQALKKLSNVYVSLHVVVVSDLTFIDVNQMWLPENWI